MTVTDNRGYTRGLHPVHGMLLAGTVPLFLGGLLSDYAYSSTHEIQWSNFASWLIAGGLVFGGFALLCAVIGLFGSHRGRPHFGLYVVLLLATWVLGFFNALTHAKDAWAVMPTGLILSVIVFLLACASTWIGFARFGVGGAK